MEDRIKNCMAQASRARQKALMSGDPEQKAGWTAMAVLWDDMVKEYRKIDVEYEAIERAKALARPPDSK